MPYTLYLDLMSNVEVNPLLKGVMDIGSWTLGVRHSNWILGIH